MVIRSHEFQQGGFVARLLINKLPGFKITYWLFACMVLEYMPCCRSGVLLPYM